MTGAGAGPRTGNQAGRGRRARRRGTRKRTWAGAAGRRVQGPVGQCLRRRRAGRGRHGRGRGAGPGPALAAIPVRTPARCGHGETICRECAGTWVTGGWALHFARTARGRRLRDELGGEALAEMTARRAAGLDPAAVRAHQVMADAVRAGNGTGGRTGRGRSARRSPGTGRLARKRDLEGGSKGLSGASYVVGELDTSHRGADGKLVPGLCRAAIPVRTVNRCGHCETVCARCAEVWMYDWKFYFDRTIGGRRLRAGLGGEAALAVMAARRAAWENQAAEAASAAGRAPAQATEGPDGAGHAGGPGRSGLGQRRAEERAARHPRMRSPVAPRQRPPRGGRVRVLPVPRGDPYRALRCGARAARRGAGQ